MTKKEVLTSVSGLVKDLDDVVNDIVRARLDKDEKGVSRAHWTMETLACACKQELSFLYDYINESIKD